MNTNRFLKVHPGRVLLEEFLAPRGVSVWHLARDIGVPTRRVYDIVQGQRAIDTDIAHRLGALLRHVRALLARSCRRGMT